MDARPNLRENTVAARKVAVIHKGQLVLVGDLYAAVLKGHNRAEHPQERNDASGQRNDPKAIRDTESIENFSPQRAWNGAKDTCQIK